MKRNTLILIGVVAIVSTHLATVKAISCLSPQQGGTGLCQATSSNIGQVIGVTSIGSNSIPVLGYTTATGGSASATTLFAGNGITLTPNPINTTGTVAVNTSTINALITAFGYITSAPATSTDIAGGGTATGPAITFSTSTVSGTYNIVCSASTCVFTVPPASDYLASSTTYVATFNTRSGTVTLSSADVTTALGFTPLSAAVISINGNTNAAQTFSAGAGISVSSASGNTTTTNIGVTSISTTTPIVADKATGTVTLSCPTCLTTSPLPVANGGTGTTTAAAKGDILIGNGTTFAHLATTTSATATTTPVLVSSSSATLGVGWQNLPTSWEFLGSAVSPNGGSSDLGAVSIPPREQLEICVSVTGYSGGDIASLRFNGDSGNDYSTRYLSWAANSTTTTNNATQSTNFFRIFAATQTTERSACMDIGNSSTTFKAIAVNALSGPKAVATQPIIQLGGGEFATNTKITSVDLLTAGGQNLNASTTLLIFGRNP